MNKAFNLRSEIRSEVRSFPSLGKPSLGRGCMEDLVTVKELASVLKLTQATVYKLLSTGKLPGFKIGDSWRSDMNEIRKIFRGIRRPTDPDLEGQKVMKSFPTPLNPGEKLRLRDDALPLLKRRFWIFAGMGKEHTILLGHEGSGSVWEAKPNNIDWKEYKRRKDSE
jgi:excisionase family DNA binding protein